MDSNFGAKGDEYMAKGDKAFKGTTFGNIFGSKGERAEKALEFYKQAATQYKLGKRWDEAAEAYNRCVSCDKVLKTGEQGEFLVEVANAKKNINTAEAIQYLNQAIEFFLGSNRLDNASRLKKQIAEMYEQDFEYVLAAKAYSEAADFYQAEGNQIHNYNTMRVKVAELSTMHPDGNLVQAIKIFEEVGDKYMENKLTAPSAKELYFKACLLYLCNDDSVGCANALEKFIDKDPSFSSTRQYKFVQQLIKAVDSNDVQLFSEESYQFNQIITLDKWKLNVLNKIKEKIKPNLVAGENNNGFL